MYPKVFGRFRRTLKAFPPLSLSLSTLASLPLSTDLPLSLALSPCRFTSNTTRPLSPSFPLPSLLCRWLNVHWIRFFQFFFFVTLWQCTGCPCREEGGECHCILALLFLRRRFKGGGELWRIGRRRDEKPEGWKQRRSKWKREKRDCREKECVKVRERERERERERREMCKRVVLILGNSPLFVILVGPALSRPSAAISPLSFSSYPPSTGFSLSLSLSLSLSVFIPLPPFNKPPKFRSLLRHSLFYTPIPSRSPSSSRGFSSSFIRPLTIPTLVRVFSSHLTPWLVAPQLSQIFFFHVLWLASAFLFLYQSINCTRLTCAPTCGHDVALPLNIQFPFHERIKEFLSWWKFTFKIHLILQFWTQGHIIAFIWDISSWIGEFSTSVMLDLISVILRILQFYKSNYSIFIFLNLFFIFTFFQIL